MLVDLIIANADVFTMAGEGVGYVADGAIAIQGNTIISVGPTEVIKESYVAKRTFDARKKAVLPIG